MLATPLLAAARPASAQTANSLSFVLHAAFFSLEAKQPTLVDPQVFVEEDGAPGGVGPQNITHASGLRPAQLMDPPGSALFAANGTPLGFTLQTWAAAQGSVNLAPEGGGTHVAARFVRLIPNGRYSLFENHFAPEGVSFSPLDGTGTRNSFTSAADGTATIVLTAPGAVTHANAVLLVYHSDGKDHGIQRGSVGVTAHHQLIARP
ncbi:hypothetical protein EPN44_01340 [bacterium]|nr:MAG: hypothetical protein EPN44_01340 [bacterium]